MESEITLKNIEWKQGGEPGKLWRMLRLTDSAGYVYSAFENEIKEQETKDLIAHLKAGDALKIQYETGTWKGKEVRNLKGILEYEPASVPPPSTRSDSASKSEMTKADWERKDNQYYWTQLFAAVLAWDKEGVVGWQECLAKTDEAFDKMKTKVNEETKE